MSIFEDITLGWDDKKYVIPSDRVMGAIARVEEHVTMRELAEYASSPSGSRFARVSMAYASLLRYAGAQVTDEEVYKKLTKVFTGDDKKDNSAPVIYAAVFGLLSLMLPPDSMRDLGDSAGKGEAPTASGSSQKRTKRR